MTICQVDAAKQALHMREAAKASELQVALNMRQAALEAAMLDDRGYTASKTKPNPKSYPNPKPNWMTKVMQPWPQGMPL